MKAQDIIDKLRSKHSKDIFVTECKTGASYGRFCQRFDAWAMNRSWANWCCTGYEIKINRADFMNDNKTTGYLAFCHELYYVCPWKMISPEEMPDYAGLMWAAPNSSRIIRKKKAPRRLELDDNILIYVLMARAAIVNEHDIVTGGGRGFWKRWLQQKNEDIDLGYHVSKKIREAYKKQVEIVRNKNSKLTRRIEELEYIEKQLKKWGFDTESLSFYTVTQKLERLQQIVKELIPDDILRDLNNAMANLERAKDELLQLRKENE